MDHDKDKLTVNSTNRRDSTISSSRTLSPVVFFHDSVLINKTFMGAERRAQAIATAPRRKRHDDDKDEEEEQKKNSSWIY